MSRTFYMRKRGFSKCNRLSPALMIRLKTAFNLHISTVTCGRHCWNPRAVGGARYIPWFLTTSTFKMKRESHCLCVMTGRHLVNALGTYSGITQFESRPKYRLLWLRIFVIFLGPSRHPARYRLHRTISNSNHICHIVPQTIILILPSKYICRYPISQRKHSTLKTQCERKKRVLLQESGHAEMQCMSSTK
jgi:hypothetical protein